MPRILGGEPIDIAGKGDELAAQFPDLGMDGPMIVSAIERAVGMVDLIRNGTEPSEAPAKRENGTADLIDYAEPKEDGDNGSITAAAAQELDAIASDRLPVEPVDGDHDVAEAALNGHSETADAYPSTMVPQKSAEKPKFFALGALTVFRRAFSRA